MVTMFFIIFFLSLAGGHATWIYAWHRVKLHESNAIEELKIPNPWKDFSLNLLSFTMSSAHLRIKDERARFSFKLNLAITYVSFALLALWLIGVALYQLKS